MNRRRTLVIRPQAQKRMVLAMTLTPAIGLMATMALVCFFCSTLFREATELNVRLESLVPLFLAVSGFVLVTALFLLSNALVFSHRIAGPTYRICKSIEQIRKGDLAFKVSLRKGDYLFDVQDELNLLLDALNANPPAGFRTRAMVEADSAEAAETAADQAGVTSLASTPGPLDTEPDARETSLVGPPDGRSA